MTTYYYTASSLDGFIATPEHSLEWLLKQDIDHEGPMAYAAFEKGIGALAMGASTYEWLLRNQGEEPWSYAQPTWVFTHRDLPTPEGADVRFVEDDVRTVHREMVAAAGRRTSGSSVGENSPGSSPMPIWSTRSGCSTHPSRSARERRCCRVPSTWNCSMWRGTGASSAVATA